MKNLRLTLILALTILLLAPLGCTSKVKAEKSYQEGLAYMKEEDLNKAMESFNRSIDIDPLGNPEAYFYRAQVYESLGRHENAVSDYLKSCELGSVHCAEVIPDKLVDLQKVPKSEWEVGDSGHHIDSQGGNTYGPLNAVDGLPKTAWVTKADPSSVLGDMMIGFRSPADTTVDRFTIRNGYCKSMDIWKKNSRVKRAAVIINGKPVGTFEIKDIIYEQTFSLGKEYRLKAGDIISFLIIETYTGSTYADVAISEIRLANDTETVMNDTGTIPLPMTRYPYSPMGHGNLGRTNTYDEEGVPVFHRVKWKFKTGSLNTSTPCVTGGVVYFGSSDGKLYAVDVKTGKELWRFQTEYSIWSDPCVADGVVYIGSGDKSLYAVDLKGGKELWRFKTGNSISSDPCVWEGVVYFGSDDKNLYAVNAKTGKEVWRFKTEHAVKTSPSFWEGVIYFEGDDNIIYAVDAKTGKEVWRVTEEKEIWTSQTPSVIDGMVYFRGGDDTLYGVDAKTGEEVLKFRWKSCIGSWCLSDGVVYFCGNKGPFECVDCDTLYAVDITSGLELWQTSCWVNSYLCVVDGVVYVMDKYDLCAIDTHTGKELWRFETKLSSDGGAQFSSPCVVDGVVYFGSPDGYVYAVE
jgi:outer membrane protein assembly factor BamB